MRSLRVTFSSLCPPSLCPSIPPSRSAQAAPPPRARRRAQWATGTGWKAPAQAPGWVSTRQETSRVGAEGTAVFKKQKPERFSWTPMVLPRWGLSPGDAPATGASQETNQLGADRQTGRDGQTNDKGWTDKRRSTFPVSPETQAEGAFSNQHEKSTTKLKSGGNKYKGQRCTVTGLCSQLTAGYGPSNTRAHPGLGWTYLHFL